MQPVLSRSNNGVEFAVKLVMAIYWTGFNAARVVVKQYQDGFAIMSVMAICWAGFNSAHVGVEQ